MATITTRAQQAKIGAAARRVGSYRALIELDRLQSSAPGKITKDAKSGEYRVSGSNKKPKRLSFKSLLGNRAKVQIGNRGKLLGK